MRGKGVWDDPEWQRLRKRVNNRGSSTPTTPPDNHKTIKDSTNSIKPITEPIDTSQDVKKLNLSLNLTVPKIKLHKRHKKVVFGLAGIAIIGLAGFGIFRVTDKPSSNEITGVLAENVAEPEFDTVLPDGKKESTEENKIGYDAQRKVASFRDSIDGTPITVSQQPLPEAFKANPDEEVKKVAEGFSANEIINESNPKAYLGTDVSGAQSVIFHKNDLLIFILSSKKIDKAQWAEYITKLL